MGENADLEYALEDMNDGYVNTVLYIAPDFSQKIQQGSAQITYYINQAAPGMTKQAMKKVALNI
jgi:hypothetical protein